MQNTRLTFPCLFLHDSLMAALAEQQTAVRLHLLAADNELPFSILPPLCPCPVMSGDFVPEVDALINDSGWLLYPVKPLSPLVNAQNLEPLSPDTTLPGYPPFPRTTGFILGYAGEKAENMVNMNCPGKEKLPKIPFSVKFWYRANVTIESNQDSETGTIITRWTIGEKIR